VFIQYWSMRVMAYLAVLVFLVALWGAWLLWRRRLETSKWFLRLAVWTIPVPFIISIAGWMLTENGRQPWIVQGLQLVKNANSPNVGTAWIITSLIGFVLLYAVMAVVDWWLMGRYARRELAPAEAEEPAQGEETGTDLLEFTY
jgi:cytochrome d ubiquinol oxidase subunit I